MAKSPEAFRTISEVADWLGLQAHVLRFWESRFTQVKPVKRAGGRRYYRPVDMLLLGGIRQLLHEDGLTIKGVQKVLQEKGVNHVAQLSRPLDDVTLSELGDAAPVPAGPAAGAVPAPDDTAEQPRLNLSDPQEAAAPVPDAAPAPEAPQEPSEPAAPGTEAETPAAPETEAPSAPETETETPPVRETETETPAAPDTPDPVRAKDAEAQETPLFSRRRPSKRAPQEAAEDTPPRTAPTGKAPSTEPEPPDDSAQTAEPAHAKTADKPATGGPRPAKTHVPEPTLPEAFTTRPGTLGKVYAARALAPGSAGEAAALRDRLMALRDRLSGDT